jgi:hypothetical protein
MAAANTPAAISQSGQASHLFCGPRAAPCSRARRGMVGGTVLIVLGLLIFAEQVLHTHLTGLLFVPLLGAAFLAWGILCRRYGLLIPGGILLGVGAGSFLVDGPLHTLAEPARGGAFLLAFAAGWLLITLTAFVFQHRLIWWPLIPGGIFGLIGSAMAVVNLANVVWPLALVAIGLSLILRRR